MIGLVIVAHGSLAEALLAATEHVVGPQPNAAFVPIHPTDDLHARQAEIDRVVAQMDTGAGVVLITDMFGGTPSNLALGSMRGDNIEVICGANLPLLVKLSKVRERPLAEAVQAALEAGHKYIDSAASILDPDRDRRRRTIGAAEADDPAKTPAEAEGVAGGSTEGRVGAGIGDGD